MANEDGLRLPAAVATNHVRPEVTSDHAGVLAFAVTWSRLLVLVTMLAFIVPAVLDPSAQPRLVMTAVAVGLVAGVPHGALDHLLAMRLCDRSTLQMAAAYAVLAAMTWVLLQWAGTAGLLAVLALSALHFGLGELEVARAVTGWKPGAPTSVAIAIAGCGALLLPLARSGDDWRTVATAISPGLATAIGSPAVHIALAATWLIAAAVAVAVSLRNGHRTVALDIGLIGALGCVASPLAAFAVWFGGWHSLRHTARVLTLEPGCSALLDAGRRRAAVLRLLRLAALPSAAVLTVVAILVGLTASAPDPGNAVAEVLRLLLALTVPHMVVVFWMDRRAAERP